jgi:hypothetical protein
MKEKESAVYRRKVLLAFLSFLLSLCLSSCGSGPAGNNPGAATWDYAALGEAARNNLLRQKRKASNAFLVVLQSRDAWFRAKYYRAVSGHEKRYAPAGKLRSACFLRGRLTSPTYFSFIHNKHLIGFVW